MTAGSQDADTIEGRDGFRQRSRGRPVRDGALGLGAGRGPTDEEHLGRECLYLESSTATVADVELVDGADRGRP